MRILFFVLVAALAAATGPVHAAADSKKSEAYLNDAHKSLQKNDLKTALIQLKNAVQADPDNGAARYELGVAQIRVGDYLSAEKELRAARDRNYNEPQTTVALADVYLRQQKFDLLLTEVKPGYREASVESDIHLSRGLALFSLQRTEEAETELQTALKDTTKKARVLTAIARLKATRGDNDGALATLNEAIEADDKYVEAYILLGQVKRLTGDRDAARQAYDKALEVNPNADAARLNRAQLLVDQNQIALAQSDLAAVLKRQPKNGLALYLSSLILARQQQYREAESTLQNMGTLLNAYPPALYLLAGINMAQNQLAQAEDAINRYIAAVPDDPNGAAFLGRLLVRRGNVPRAITVLSAALDKNAGNARLLAMLSDAYIRNKQPEESAKVLDRITALAPDNPALRTQVATQRMRIGQLDQAVADLETANHESNSPQTKILLILGYLQENKLDDAAKTATALRDEQPENPVAENLLGVVELRKSGVAAGRQHFEKAVELKPDFVPGLMNLAQIARLERKPDEARGIYDRILKLDAVNEGALLGQADIAFEANQPDDGVLWLEKARNGNARSTTARVRLVDAYLARRDGKHAAEVARELAAAAPGDPAAMRLVGRAHLLNNDVPSALAAFQSLAELEPSTANFLDLGRAFATSRDLPNARLWFEKALDLAPGDLGAIRTYVEFSAATQTLPDSISFARRQRDLRTKSPGADLLLGDLQIAAGRKPDALRTYQEGLERSETPLFVSRIATLQAEDGAPDKATATYDAWLKKHPDDANTRFLLASLLLTTKQYDRAIAEHEAMLKTQADNAVLLNNLAWLYDMKGDPRALETAEKAVARAPDAPTIADTYGWILVKKGDPAKGLTVLAKAASAAPAVNEIQLHYAVALKDSGKTDDAKAVLEKIVASKTTTPEVVEAKKLLEAMPKP